VLKPLHSQGNCQPGIGSQPTPLEARCIAGGGEASSCRFDCSNCSEARILVPLRLLRARSAGCIRAAAAASVDNLRFVELEERFFELEERGIAFSILSGR
jgi:hypothetical protein